MRTSEDQTNHGREDANRTIGLAPLATDLLRERSGGLPVWIRAPSRGHEHYTGLTRPKLYELAAKRRIRTCCIRKPGRTRGMRLFHLESVLAYIESQCAELKEALVTETWPDTTASTASSAPTASAPNCQPYPVNVEQQRGAL